MNKKCVKFHVNVLSLQLPYYSAICVLFQEEESYTTGFRVYGCFYLLQNLNRIYLQQQDILTYFCLSLPQLACGQL